jgi:hypothetical protein
MTGVGFESTIPVFKRAKMVHALDRAATVTASSTLFKIIIRKKIVGKSSKKGSCPQNGEGTLNIQAYRLISTLRSIIVIVHFSKIIKQIWFQRILNSIKIICFLLKVIFCYNKWGICFCVERYILRLQHKNSENIDTVRGPEINTQRMHIHVEVKEPFTKLPLLFECLLG